MCLPDEVKSVADQVLSAVELPETDPLDVADLIMDEALQQITIDDAEESRIADQVLRYVVTRTSRVSVGYRGIDPSRSSPSC